MNDMTFVMAGLDAVRAASCSGVICDCDSDSDSDKDTNMADGFGPALGVENAPFVFELAPLGAFELPKA